MPDKRQIQAALSPRKALSSDWLSWQALLLVGFLPEEVEAVKELMKELDAEMVKVTGSHIILLPGFS